MNKKYYLLNGFNGDVKQEVGEFDSWDSLNEVLENKEIQMRYAWFEIYECTLVLPKFSKYSEARE